MSKSANRKRQPGNLDRQRVVSSTERRHDARQQQGLVLLDHAPLQLALRSISEGVRPASPEEFQFRKEPENRNGPGSQPHLAWMTGDGIAPCEQRRSQMKGDTAAVEALSQLGKKAGFHVKARNLVFILV